MYKMGIVFLIVFGIMASCSQKELLEKPRVIISSDIGGTDPDDFQSMIHLLMYADLFQIEGLISSPYGYGRKKDIFDMLDLYERDLGTLRTNSSDFPSADILRTVCKQGAISEAPYKGFNTATEGSEWIVKCAQKPIDMPLWVLVWGGLEDLAQALHDAPEIKEKIQVYWIGGPNKKWSINAYSYICANHPDLWMIEANASYRGWFMDSESPDDIKGENFFNNYIKDRGAMGRAFKKYYGGDIKMGDTPSLAYVMDGTPDDPKGESWGGSFIPIKHSSRIVFDGNSTIKDTVATYATLEWRFKGPKLAISQDSTCFKIKVNNQNWSGYYLGNGSYGVRYSSKKPEIGNYRTTSKISELDGLSGQYVSVPPWPGKDGPDDYQLGLNWYSDRPEPQYFMGEQQGARTVSKHREAFLHDWAQRWEWLK